MSSLGLMALNDGKAGMTGIDVDKINSIIEEASKGSKFYKAKAKSQSRIDEQVKRLRKSLEKLTDSEIAKATAEMDVIVRDLKKCRDLSRTIVHVDMDAFYAAVEIRDNPSLESKPMAVGSTSMLSTSNYLARRFGVRAGMPGFIAKKLCPELVVVPLNFKKYEETSRVIRGVFAEYDPNFCPVSLDEAYLDITDYLFGESSFGDDYDDPESVVDELRTKIFEKTKLTASAGIAANTMLAKVCSDINKPNGQFYLKAEEIEEFVARLPIRKVSGIGNVTEQLLKAVGVKTCKDLFDLRGQLSLLFSEISSHNFLRISLGLAGTTRLQQQQNEKRKSISTETTFRDSSDPEKLISVCKELCRDLTFKKICGRTVTLKIKTHDFKIKTRALTLIEPTSSGNVIENSALTNLRWFMDNAEEKPLKLRLMGVRLSDLSEQEEFKQKTIDNFLKHRKEEEEEYECPSCQKSIIVPSLSAFNSHLDRCLLQESSSSSRSVCPICTQSFRVLSDFDSRHIDECLNKQTISQILKRKKIEENPSSSSLQHSSNKKAKTIKSYFRSS